jgi:cell division protein FtsI/penicillin-binding protein 2
MATVGLIAVMLGTPDAGVGDEAHRSQRAVAEPLPPEESIAPDPREGLDLNALVLEQGRLVQHLDDRVVVTTLEPDLQGFAQDLLERFEVPAGAAVVLNSRTGEVLALAQHSERTPGAPVALQADAPAASLFKIVTAAALLEWAGIAPDSEHCFHGGHRGIQANLLTPNPRRDRRCASFSLAMGRSLNVVFARLADRYLTPEQLLGMGQRFGFNEEISFDLPLGLARLDVPQERVERARTAAGFWHSYLSPLQAAMMAQALAQEGALLRPYVVDEVRDPGGQVLHNGHPQLLGRVCRPETAHQLAAMMVTTTRIGTARSSFRDRQGRFILGEIDVAGKTGTLHGRRPFRAYDWFVGFAPADAPEVAVAGLVVNDPQWRIKGHYVGRELIRYYFRLQRQRLRQAAQQP